MTVPTPRKGVDLVKRLVEMSQQLLDSRKVVGVVKRVETAAIDGWTIRRLGTRDLALSRNDKDVLASFMALLIIRIFSGFLRSFCENSSNFEKVARTFISILHPFWENFAL